MSFIKNLLAGMLTSRHGGYSKHNRYQSRGHHGQGYYDESPINNTMASSQSCPSCQHENSSQAKFCGQCGKSLNTGNCTACGQKLVPGSKFCGGCGQAV